MAVIPRESLFEPATASPLRESTDWIGTVIFGEVALGLCVLAVAFVGFAMLFGRLPVREALRVVVGCFILLGAPVIASGLMWGGTFQTEPLSPPIVDEGDISPRGELPPSTYDPYAGASLRQD